MNSIKLITISLALLYSTVTFSQDRKEIHYLADTLSTNKGNRILEIGKEGKFTYYMFYCKCVPPYGLGYNLSFATPTMGESNVKKTLPDFNFISWKELSELAEKHNLDFDKKFKFYITEILPNKTYRTSEVKIVNYKEPIRDYITIPSKE